MRKVTSNYLPLLENAIYSIVNLIKTPTPTGDEEQIKHVNIRPIYKNTLAITSKYSFEVFTETNIRLKSIYFKELNDLVLFKWNNNGE